MGSSSERHHHRRRGGDSRRHEARRRRSASSSDRERSPHHQISHESLSDRVTVPVLPEIFNTATVGTDAAFFVKKQQPADNLPRSWTSFYWLALASAIIFAPIAPSSPFSSTSRRSNFNHPATTREYGIEMERSLFELDRKQPSTPYKSEARQTFEEIMNMLSSNDNANDNNGTMMDTNFTAPDNYDYGNQAKAMFGGYGSAVNGGGRDSPFRSRPRGIRYRDEPVAYGDKFAWMYQDQQRNMVDVMPIVVERPLSALGQRQMMPTTSQQQQNTYSETREDPSLLDIEVIDVMWRNDIATEKGSRQLLPAEQYERDLQMLTEKSMTGVLSREETCRYEECAKVYYEDFYNAPPTANAGNRRGGDLTKTTFASPSSDDEERLDAAASGFGADLDQQSKSGSGSETFGYPTDEDLKALLDDVSLPDSELNQLRWGESQTATRGCASCGCGGGCIAPASTDRNHGIINNVSLADGIVYNQNNATELTYLQQEQQQQEAQQEAPAHNTDLYNETTVQMHPWVAQAEMGPNEMYPTRDAFASYIQQEERTMVVSSGSGFNHSYQSLDTPSDRSRTQSSNDALSLYDPYYPQGVSRMSFSNNDTFSTTTTTTTSSSSTNSPRYSETENQTPSPPASRYFGKLAPSQHETDRVFKTEPIRSSNSISSISGGSQPRRRGRQSKDEQLACDNGLPVSAKEIAEMSLADLQKMLKNERLNEAQKMLVRKIRRRGKNKVAARTCRQRRSDRVPSPGKGIWLDSVAPSEINI